MRGKNGICKVTSRQIKRVKSLLGKHSLREISRLTKLSYSSVWHIKSGNYDTDKPLPVKITKTRAKLFNINDYQCWLVGGTIEKRIRKVS